MKGYASYEGDQIHVITEQDFQNEKLFDENDGNADQTVPDSMLFPTLGSEVYGRVNKVEDRFCRVQILAIGTQPLNKNSNFSGIIFKENVREYDRDNITMHKCFVPNDIIKAKVIQEASGQGMSVQLSTVDDDLGVKYAWSQFSGQLMVPKNWTEF